MELTRIQEVEEKGEKEKEEKEKGKEEEMEKEEEMKQEEVEQRIEDRARQVFGLADADGDGFIGLDEFVTMGGGGGGGGEGGGGGGGGGMKADFTNEEFGRYKAEHLP